MSKGEQLEERIVAPGKVYRDLDGSLVHLLAIKRNLCSWVPISGVSGSVQVTHVENFRRRFRKIDTGQADDISRAA